MNSLKIKGEVIFVDGGYHAIGMAQLENLAPVQS